MIFLPLDELIGLNTAKPHQNVEVNVSSMVSEACKLKTVPQLTESVISRNELPALKQYLQNLDPATMVPRLSESFLAAGIDPTLALVGQAVSIYLKEHLPASEYEMTPTGLQQVVKPSKSQDTNFMWKCQVAQNPYYVMSLFSQRQLTGFDMDCLESLYPEQNALLSQALVEYMMENYSADPAIPRPLRTMIAIFFGSPTIKLEQLAAYKNLDKKAESKLSNTAASPNVSQLEGK
jgi:hypothetical protein